MNKAKNAYVCNACGAMAAKWLGSCPDCGAWNSLTETLSRETKANRFTSYAVASVVQDLAAVALQDMPRMSTGLPELDRVLGGGQVAGAAMLLGGDPGIGKSTLLLQAISHLSQHSKVLYVTGEESAAQVAMRARRLGFWPGSPRIPLFSRLPMELKLTTTAQVDEGLASAIPHSALVRGTFRVRLSIAPLPAK